jgi:hypothetical protein
MPWAGARLPPQPTPRLAARSRAQSRGKPMHPRAPSRQRPRSAPQNIRLTNLRGACRSPYPRYLLADTVPSASLERALGHRSSRGCRGVSGAPPLPPPLLRPPLAAASHPGAQLQHQAAAWGGTLPRAPGPVPVPVPSRAPHTQLHTPPGRALTHVGFTPSHHVPAPALAGQCRLAATAPKTGGGARRPHASSARRLVVSSAVR